MGFSPRVDLQRFCDRCHSALLAFVFRDKTPVLEMTAHILWTRKESLYIFCSSSDMYQNCPSSPCRGHLPGALLRFAMSILSSLSCFFLYQYAPPASISFSRCLFQCFHCYITNSSVLLLRCSCPSRVLLPYLKLLSPKSQLRSVPVRFLEKPRSFIHLNVSFGLPSLSDTRPQLLIHVLSHATRRHKCALLTQRFFDWQSIAL